MNVYLHVHLEIHDRAAFMVRHSAIDLVAGIMSESDAHYTLSLINHQRGQQLKLELIDLPFPARSYRLRVNGHWAKKLPVASKTAVMRQLRQWWVAH
jgi:hypothetical protein